MSEASSLGANVVSLAHVETEIITTAPRQRIINRFLSHRFALVGCILLLVLALATLLAPVIAPYQPTKVDFGSLNQPPSAQHWFGTDGVGRDVFTRLLYGGQVSLTVGIFAVALYLGIGVTLGTIAGYKGGWIDNLIMRFTDIMMCFPSFVLMLILVGIVGASLFNMVFIIGLFGWTGIARLIRAQVLYLRELDYVTAARSIGCKERWILLNHIIPNLRGSLIVAATLGIGGAILAEAGLSFLGLGIAKPNPTWGTMLNDARSPAQIEDQPWLWIAPGLAISITVLSINFIGDGLRDAFDVRNTNSKG